jgi:hypothetical protein
VHYVDKLFYNNPVGEQAAGAERVLAVSVLAAEAGGREKIEREIVRNPGRRFAGSSPCSA